MKILYAARYARLDLLRAVCALAQFITKWDEQCDLRLYRLVCYINSTYHLQAPTALLRGRRLRGLREDELEHIRGAPLPPRPEHGLPACRAVKEAGVRVTQHS